MCLNDLLSMLAHIYPTLRFHRTNWWCRATLSCKDFPAAADLPMGPTSAIAIEYRQLGRPSRCYTTQRFSKGKPAIYALELAKDDLRRQLWLVTVWPLLRGSPPLASKSPTCLASLTSQSPALLWAYIFRSLCSPLHKDYVINTVGILQPICWYTSSRVNNIIFIILDNGIGGLGGKNRLKELLISIYFHISIPPPPTYTLIFSMHWDSFI